MSHAEPNAYTRTLLALEQIALSQNLPIAIVGGLAGIFYETQVTTLDVDIVVARADDKRFLTAAEQAGFTIKRCSDDGWHALCFPDSEGDVLIEMIPEGGRSPRDPVDAPAVPGPSELGVATGLGYATFGKWVQMKLVAARDKDRYHLIEALKRTNIARTTEAVQCLRALPPRYLLEFERLVRAAEDEQSENW